MTEKEALSLLEKHLKNKNLIKHSLAVAQCMRNLANKFNSDSEKWAIAGLLHDLDYEETKDNFEKHGITSALMLKDSNLDEEIIYAIKAHSGHFERKTPMDKALYAIDPTTGLIIAAALMHPDKKLNSLSSDFILRRFNEKHFAKGANREQIKSCNAIHMSLEDFIEHCLKSMSAISKELGL